MNRIKRFSLPTFILNFFVLSIFIFLLSPSVFASESWTQLGLVDRRVESLVNDPTSINILYAGTDNGIYKSNDGGNNWIIKSNQGISASIVDISSSNPNVLYATKGSSRIQKSTDTGNTWVDVTNNLGPAVAILDLAIDSTNSNIVYVAMYGQCGGIWKTTNGGTTWNSVSGGCDFYRVAIAPSNHNIIYAGSLNLTGYFIKSVDGGNTWTNPSNQGLGSVGAVRGIAIDPNNPSIIYVGTEIGGVFKSIDGAVNWTFLSNSPSTAVSSALTINPTNGTIYSRSSTGVSESRDGGFTWISINSGQTPPPAGIFRLMVFTNNLLHLYATTTTGVYVYGLTDNQPVTLNIPYFSQNDSSWGPTEYDHSIQLGFPNPTMDRWGCAVTSAAMVLNFHNIKEMPDGTDLDPGSLNVWLKNNNGYAIGYKNMDGWYSYLKFPSISTLTKRIFDARKSNTKLEYKRTKTNLTQTLDSDLSIGKFPDIIKVSNDKTSSHFVVAKGKTNNTYLINDPEWNHPTLESFNNNTFSQLDRFVPSNTNLSYFLAVVNPSVEMMITAPDNKRTGKNLTNNEELNQIDNASYSLQLPISNPNDNDQNENLGTGVNEFLLPEPIEGNYEIKLSSEENGFYEINLATFKENGDNDSNYIRGIITENNDETIKANYSQVNNTNINKIVSFSDLIKDLNELKGMNQFKNNGIYNSLLAKATVAQLVNFVSEKTSNNILKAMLNEIKAQRGKGITEDAYQVLFYNINYLINT